MRVIHIEAGIEVYLVNMLFIRYHINLILEDCLLKSISQASSRLMAARIPRMSPLTQNAKQKALESLSLSKMFKIKHIIVIEQLFWFQILYCFLDFLTTGNKNILFQDSYVIQHL